MAKIFFKKCSPVLVLVFTLLLPLLVWGADIYIDNKRGNDTNPGSKVQPLKTISTGVNKAHASDTVWIFSGNYREIIKLVRSGTSAQKPVTIRSIPGNDVQIKGSDIVTEWNFYSGKIWKIENWDTNSQQVFVDGVPLQQIGTNSPFHNKRYLGKPILPAVGNWLSDMTAGSFWYNKGTKSLYVWLSDGSNPRLHKIEASVRDFVIPPQDMRNYIHLIDLNFSHSNITAKGLPMGIVNVWGNSWLIKGCTFSYGDFAGIHIIGVGHHIVGNRFNNNGGTGININGSDDAHGWRAFRDRSPQNILLEANETCSNNYRSFSSEWHAGGIKVIPSGNTIKITQHKSVGNDGPGIWFDGWCKNIIIDRCTVTDNKRSGIFYEISDDAVISNNLVLRNAQQGIYVASSDGVKVYNNTIHNNWAGIVLHGMPRAEHPSLSNNAVRNNIISNNSFVDFVLYDNPSTAINNASDYNLYNRGDGSVKISFTKHKGYAVNYRRLTLFSLATQLEGHSLIANPLWVDESSGNFELAADSLAIDSGTPVKEIGNRDFNGNTRITAARKTSDKTIDIGAYEYQLSE